jgi:DNA-binding HxlR family transcriptional regulator
MAEYHQYCPVARAAEILADRWTPLIVRELLAGAGHFNAIERGLPGISRSLLASRLRLLTDAGIILKHQGRQSNRSEYELTRAGRDLQRVLNRLGEWGVRWAFGDPRPEELDPVLLLWNMHRRIRRDLLPATRTVVEFDFRGRGGRRLWLVLEPREISVCLKPPGFDSDLVVGADLSLFYRVWLGDVDYHAAVRSGRIEVEGPLGLTRDFPRWLMWSPMAHYVKAHSARSHHDEHSSATRGEAERVRRHAEPRGI